MKNEKSYIYLDYAATTPLAPQVLKSMLPFFSEDFGNPSSIHHFGQVAEAALEKARIRIAEQIGCKSNEIIFTSGGTESDNLGLRGIALAMKEKTGANHILITPVEHPAIHNTAFQLAAHDQFILEFIPIDHFGIVDPDEIKKRIRKNTAVVSVIFANNEIGTINPITELGALCKSYDIPFHTDAVQAAAHLPLQIDKLNINALSIGGHKFYGPKGVGALFIKSGTPILPVQTGGGQEANLRAGTHNIPYIIGLAEAFLIAQDGCGERENRYNKLKELIISEVLNNIPGSHLTGHPIQRLPNHASFLFEGLNGNNLVMLLDLEGFACSSGSACKTGNPKPSEVLTAMGYSPEFAMGSLRVTIGVASSEDEIRLFLSALPDIVRRARNM